MAIRTPVYDRDHIRLFLGDCVEDEFLKDDDTFSVILTDPPYATFRYIQELEQTGHIDMKADAAWSGLVGNWVGTWWFPLRMRMTDDGVMWIFANTHYVGFYLRWARLTKITLRGIFVCPPDEFLLAFGPKRFTTTEASRVAKACMLNSYGQNKPVEMLRKLLECSPPGAVLDPFMGQGSTMLAARDLDRPAVGIEVRPEYVRSALTKFEEWVPMTERV